MTPATSITDPRAWFALFRYSTSFSGTNPYLKLDRVANTWDSRLTAIIAEEISVGICHIVARDYLDVVHFADVQPLIDAGQVQYVNPPPKGTRQKGAESRPDFLCLDSNNECLFIESKGVVGTPGGIPIKKGKHQVTNVSTSHYPPRSVGGVPNGDRVVIGTSICIDGVHTRSNTTTKVVDPPVGGDTLPFSEELRSDFAIRLSYAKFFNLAGVPMLGDQLIAGLPFTLDDYFLGLADTSAGEMVLFGEFPLGGLLGLHRSVWDALRAHGERNLLDSLSEPIRGLRVEPGGERDEGPGVLLNNGIGLIL